MCASLNALSKADPLWPEVPNAMRCEAISGSGLPVKYAVTSRGILTSIDGSLRLPASGLVSAITSFSFFDKKSVHDRHKDYALNSLQYISP